MSETWLNEWSEQKILLAEKLNSGECGGTYAEAVIILCSVLSGIAADTWPGKHKDRKRFVELLTRYSDESLEADKVSIPLLIGALREQELMSEADALFREFMPNGKCKIITGGDVDKKESDVVSVCPNLPKKLIRENSYAHILYKEIRSGYTHEYMPGSRSDSWAMGSERKNSFISYVNRADKPNRLIYFNVSWLVELVRSIVRSAPVITDISEAKKFKNWWLLSQ